MKEYDAFHEFIICDELSRCGSGGVLWGLIGGMTATESLLTVPFIDFNVGLGIGLPPVINFGSEYLKDKVVKDCLAGRKNICLAITEPSAGSDVANLVSEAKLSPDGKHYIVSAAACGGFTWMLSFIPPAAVERREEVDYEWGIC